MFLFSFPIIQQFVQLKLHHLALSFQEILDFISDPELKKQISTLSEGARSLILEEVTRECEESYFKASTKSARIYLAIHKSWIASSEVTPRGNVSSENVGGVSTTWTMRKNNPIGDQEIYSTTFGAEYMRLRKKYNQRIFFSR